MKTILNLLQDDILFYLDETLYTLTDDKDMPLDIMICPTEHLETAHLLVNPKECFLIAALNDKSEVEFIPDMYDAWILKSRLDEFPFMLKAYEIHIERKINLREQREIIERFSVDTSVHNANLEGIKLNMRESTKEIETIFEERVEEMREIHRDAREAHEKLTFLKEQTAPAAFAELEDSWNMTSSILGRTDEVIKAMFGFIMVLQCEDRISQMIEGIERIMQDDVTFAEQKGYTVEDELKEILKKRLIEFYTIQDQRDYANGQENAMQGCNISQPDIEELLFF